MRLHKLGFAVATSLVAVAALVGCGGGAAKSHHTSNAPATRSATTGQAGSAAGSSGPAGSPAASAVPINASAPALTATGALVATAIGPHVQVHSSAAGPVTRTFNNPQETGAPLTFLIKQESGDWLQGYLPARPNGSTGWILATDVTQSNVPYRVEVSTERHQVQVFLSGKLLDTYPASTGTGGDPTPHGLFYLTELLAPTNYPGYGPYAYGLSAFSDVITSFGGGPGQVGLHGTGNSSGVGRSESQGCVRLSNKDITTLAKMLPVGTPVHIT